jgi:hypothetical protein
MGKGIDFEIIQPQAATTLDQRGYSNGNMQVRVDR